MMRFKEFFQQYILEEFDNVGKLLSDPTNSGRTWDELMNQFESEGGEIVGMGKYGKVLKHPKWSYVLKMFPNDECYLLFIRWAMKNPSSALPVLYDKPRQVYPQYIRYASETKMYIIRMEELMPISKDTFDDIEYYLRVSQPTEEEYDTALKEYYDELEHIESKDGKKVADRIRFEQYYPMVVQQWRRLKEIENMYPNIKEMLKVYRNIIHHSLRHCTFDIHKGNIMKRSNGDLVWIDLLWDGGPYAQADQQQKMEIDYYGDRNYEEDGIQSPMLKGGPPLRPYYRKPKTKKPKVITVPQKSDTYTNSYDIPF